jgi:hypothetical protein
MLYPSQSKMKAKYGPQTACSRRFRLARPEWSGLACPACAGCYGEIFSGPIPGVVASLDPGLISRILSGLTRSRPLVRPYGLRSAMRNKFLSPVGSFTPVQSALRPSLPHILFATSQVAQIPSGSSLSQHTRVASRPTEFQI